MSPQFIIVHHSGGTASNPLADSSNYTVAMCDRDHKARGFGISSLGYHVGYQYIIEKDGKVTQCREDNEVGAHTIGKNDRSIGIMLSGNFDATLPTAEQTESLKKLLLQKISEWDLHPNMIVAHRHFAEKSCYGKKLSDSWARDLVKEAQNPLASFTSMELLIELQRREQ